jgi:catechol 2,3-dioxygenase
MTNTRFGTLPPGSRLPETTRLGSVHLQVAELERSISYYERVLGLRVFDRAARAASLGAGSGTEALVHLHAGDHVRPARRGAFGLYHFAVLLPDRGALGRFAAHLARLGARVGMADHLVSEALYLYDPDGLGIEVYADRSRDAWRYNGSELVMTTDPLDVQSLVAAGGALDWDGAPDGTAMGHVHLHVGDLREAERFYHGALGFDKTVWSYPGALFFSAGGYHHHLGTNTWSAGPSAREDEARLLEWELVLPGERDVHAFAGRLVAEGYDVDQREAGAIAAADPWATTVVVRPGVRADR